VANPIICPGCLWPGHGPFGRSRSKGEEPFGRAAPSVLTMRSNYYIVQMDGLAALFGLFLPSQAVLGRMTASVQLASAIQHPKQSADRSDTSAVSTHVSKATPHKLVIGNRSVTQCPILISWPRARRFRLHYGRQSGTGEAISGRRRCPPSAARQFGILANDFN
jgi:hypothetical protein